MLVLLFILWIILNGRFTWDAGMLQIVLVGILVAALVYAFIRRALGYTLKTELRLLRKAPLLLAYALLLVKEVVAANFQMMRLVLRKDLEIHPVMVKIRPPLKARAARVLLANSITLTPGTITAEVDGDELIVHCIDRSFSEGMENSSFVKMLERLEK